MAISNYVELTQAVSHFIGGSDDATASGLGITSTIDDLVTVAENRIFRETKTKDTEESFSYTITGSGVISVPADYLGIKFLYVNTTPTQFLEPKPPEWIYENYPTRSSDGVPKFVAREVGNFIFGPYPDSTYLVKGVYYKKLAALSSGVHNLFTNNPDLYLFGCLAEAAIIIGVDSRISLWEQKYQKILADVNGQSKNAEYGGGQLRIRIA